MKSVLLLVRSVSMGHRFVLNAKKSISSMGGNVCLSTVLISMWK